MRHKKQAEKSNSSSPAKRAGLWIFRKFFEGNRKLCPQDVRSALIRVEEGSAREEEYYYAEKFAKVITIVFVGGLFVLLLSIKYCMDRKEATVLSFERNDYGEQMIHESLTAADERGESLGVYDVNLDSRRYTAEEAKALFNELSAEMRGRILGNNESLMKVTKKLDLISKAEGYPFTISWSSSNFFRLKNDGTPSAENLSEEGEEVRLLATYAYYGEYFEQEITVRVCVPETDPEISFQNKIRDELKLAQEESIHDSTFVLPQEIDGRQISWSAPVTSSAPLLLVLVIVSAIAVWFGTDSALMKRMKKRREELSLDYAGFVSRLTLFLSAGMTVRSVFEKMAREYERKRREGGKRRYLYEEITRAVHALDGGYHEEEVYSLFASGCGLQEYTRLMTLLTQNLRKGQGKLLELLSKEAAEAGAKRLDDARVRGEQAGTKLMFPMMLMLFVVMILIMVPAYMSF